MMKKIILAIGLMFGGVAFVNAQEQQQQQQQDTTQTQQSDQYRTDTTSTDSTDDTQYQNQQNQDQSDTTSTDQSEQQSDMYRTEGEGNVNDTTSNDASTESTETESTTPTTDDQSSTQEGLTQDSTMDQDQEGEKIEVSELPASVQTKLQSTDYQGWVVVSARKKMWSDPTNAQAASKEVYVIEAKNGAETKKLKFDKDGNEIEHDKDKKDDQK
jgi:hypothetical protein